MTELQIAFSAMHITANLLTRLRDEGFSDCSISFQKEPHPVNELDRDEAITVDRAKGPAGQELESVDIGEVIESAPAGKAAQE
jgi:hypothetical protein